MDYYRHRDGRNEGPFPLDELRRRRQAGEIGGDEYIWREGMADWQPLDSVLRQNTPPARSPLPPPLPASALKRSPNQGTNWGVVTAFSLFALLFVAGAILGVVYRGSLLPIVIPGVRPFANQPTQGEARQEAMRAAGKPVTWTAATQTEADVQKQNREFRVRQWLDGYKLRGDRSEACDDEAAQYLETWISRNYGGPADTNTLTTAEWSDNLANNPACTDPLVLAVTGANCIELHEQARRLQRAISGFGNSKHLAYPKFYATVSLANNQDDLFPKRGHQMSLDADAVNLLREAFKDGSFQPRDQPEIAEILLNGWGNSLFYHNQTAVCDVVKSSGKPYKWLALVLEGEYQVNEAWKARGGGYVNTVTAQGWQGFYTHLATARDCFTSAWHLRPDLPLAPQRMIYVCLGQSGIQEMRLWFDRAVAAQVDYPGAWVQMRWGLRPRWYGNPDAMLALGVTAVNTRRFDTDVPRKIMDVVSDLESEMELGPGEHIYEREDIWPELQQMYEGYIAEPAQLAERDGWRSSYSVVAYLAGKYDVARMQLEALDWKPLPENLNGWDADLSLMKGEVAARTGASAGKVAEAEAARNALVNDKALGIYTELAADANADKRTREFARCRCAGLQMEQQLDRGDWVDFLPKSDDDPNWVFAWDESHQLSNGGLEIKSGPQGHMCYSRARMGTNFEVKGEFEAVVTSTKDYQAGLVMGMPDSDPGFHTDNWYAFRMKRTSDEGQVAEFALGWTTRQVVSPVALNSGFNTFDFRLRGNVCTAMVNGVEVLSNAQAPAAIRVPAGEFRLGLGAYNDSNDTVIRYRNVQVRKIQ